MNFDAEFTESIAGAVEEMTDGKFQVSDLEVESGFVYIQIHRPADGCMRYKSWKIDALTTEPDLRRRILDDIDAAIRAFPRLNAWRKPLDSDHSRG